MFFSVIVPIYNVEKYLRQCLDSLVNQTCTDCELIFIDDGSTDNSGAICDEYAEYPNTTVIHQANQGLSAARNAGLERATGEWLLFVDSDDWVEKDMLERLQAYILATDADAYRFMDIVTREDGSIETESNFISEDTFFSLPDEQTLFKFYQSYFSILSHVWNRIYRHSIIREHNLRFVDEKKIYAEDKLFNFQYMFHIRSMVFIGEVLYHYRVRSDSLVRSTRVEDQISRTFTLLEYAHKAIEDEGLTYFQENFHKLYFIIINTYMMRGMAKLEDSKIRQIIDGVCEKEFHRQNIKKIRKDEQNDERYAVRRKWFAKDFGKRKNHFQWALRIVKIYIKYALKREMLIGLNYYCDEEQKVAYMVVPKAGCTSIRVSMLRRDDIPDDQLVHLTKNNRRQQKPFRDKDWFIFSFVRNPFARLVSCYESKYHDSFERNALAKRRGYFDFDEYLGGYMKEDEGFEHFVNQVVGLPYRIADQHFRSQYRMLVDKDGKLLVDYVGKVENLAEDYEPIREKYGFSPLKHYNKMDYGDWRDYYTTRLAKKVYRKFKRDVVYFGYEEEYRSLLAYCREKERALISPPPHT